MSGWLAAVCFQVNQNDMLLLSIEKHQIKLKQDLIYAQMTHIQVLAKLKRDHVNHLS